jgi:nitrogen fixation protein FixH
MKMNAKVPPPLTWHIFHIIVDFFGLIMSTCILNQCKGHWLFSATLNSTIFMSLKFNDEIDFATFANLMEEDENVMSYHVWPPT